MVRINTFSKNRRETTHYERGRAYRLGQKEALYAAVVASSLENVSDEATGKRLERIRNLIYDIAREDPGFIAKLAVYTREKMHLRRLPLILVAELARIHNGDDLVRRTSARVIQRVDEIAELLAYYQQSNGRTGNKKLHKLSKQLQRGIADSFNKFDEYQFAKCNRSQEIKLRDALFLVHPKAKNAQQQVLFDKIVSNSLELPDTRQTDAYFISNRSDNIFGVIADIETGETTIQKIESVEI